jgi:hypothetical protein
MTAGMKGEFGPCRNSNGGFSCRMLQCGKVFAGAVFLQTVEARPAPVF